MKSVAQSVTETGVKVEFKKRRNNQAIKFLFISPKTQLVVVSVSMDPLTRILDPPLFQFQYYTHVLLMTYNLQ
jgi:hypothetical protein